MSSLEHTRPTCMHPNVSQLKTDMLSILVTGCLRLCTNTHLKMCRWTAEGEMAFIISRQAAATMDDLIPKAPGPLLSHQPLAHTLTHT